MSFKDKINKFTKEKINDFKADYAAGKIIKDKAKSAYRQERLEQEIRMAKERAKIDADVKIKRYKERFNNNDNMGSILGSGITSSSGGNFLFNRNVSKGSKKKKGSSYPGFW